jgi:pyridoxamine 5'-phosphate oxidase
MITNEYTSVQLTENPFDGILRWLEEAKAAQVVEPTAMSLATATKAGVPSVRIVLLKDLSPAMADGRRAPRFFTNYESRKSQELDENPQAALALFWAPMGRQIRIEGRIEKLGPEESNEYFQSRARGSRIGAWASPQSRKIATRAELLKLVEVVEKKFEGKEVPLPPHWGGWKVVPQRIEFWQAGEFRLHDRFVYEWNDQKDHPGWTISRLAP